MLDGTPFLRKAKKRNQFISTYIYLIFYSNKKLNKESFGSCLFFGELMKNLHLLSNPPSQNYTKSLEHTHDKREIGMEASKVTTPFNIDLLIIPPNILNIIKPVTSLDTYDGASKNFHPDGLYSTEIFGSVGSNTRMIKFSYIDLKIDIFHPTIFFSLMQLKGFYADIISGREFAIFDEDIKDFVKATALTGSTGYQYFIENWKKIEFKKTNSNKREQNIKLIEKYKNKSMLKHIYVMPAGYRDISVDDSGKESSDEINALYYKLIAVSNTLNKAALDISPEAYNTQRMSLQNTFNEIYKMMIGIIEGKNSLYMGKFMARRVYNGTRNVITAMKTSSNILNTEDVPGINDACIGIFQFMKSILPLMYNKIKNGFLSKVFISPQAPALLCNKNTLRSERVDVSVDDFDRWMTDEGINKLIDFYEETSVRDTPIIINDHYLGLVYRGPDNTFKLMHGVDELPSTRSSEHCTPMTYTEFFYSCIYEDASEIPGFITRYPIATDRSTFPAFAFLMSTVNSEKRIALDDNWKHHADAKKIAPRFPIRGEITYDSLAPHPSRHDKLGADHDGDMCSWVTVLSIEAITEVKNAINLRSFYVSSDNKFVHSLSTYPVEYVLKNLTGA